MSTRDLAQVAANMSTNSTPSDTGQNARGPRTPPPGRRGSATAAAKPPAANEQPPTAPVETASAQTGPPAEAPAEPSAESAVEPPAATVADAQPTSTALAAPVTRAVTAPAADASAAAEMAQPSRAGVLVQFRVQPPDVGEWTNNVIETAAYCFGAKSGEVFGAFLILARNHWDEFVATMEVWGGEKLRNDRMRQRVWDMLKNEVAATRPKVVDSE